MFGSLRLLLAIVVALSHAGVSWQGRHIGVMAVVIFLLLSGYVVSGLLTPGGRLAASPARFYIERAARLLPLYYFFMLLGGLAAFYRVDSPFLQGSGTPIQILANILVIPLNYSMLLAHLNSYLLVPPAWSLGLEIQFYLLAPWLLARQSRLLAGLFLTLALGMSAQFGYLHADWFGYRLLCGNLYIFLVGAWLHRMHHGRARPALLVAVWLALLAVWLLTGSQGRWATPFVFEVLSAFLLGLPLVAGLGRQARRRWDDELGQLAYGVFLGHFVILWLFQVSGYTLGSGPARLFYIFLAVSSAYVGHRLIERPLLDWRRRMR